MRIAFDVSPLSHPRTGVGNYVRGSLRGLVEAAATTEVVAFAPTSRAGASGDPARRSPGSPSSRGSASSRSRTSGARAGAALGRPPVERFLGPVDVLHFSDWMYPPQRGGVRSTMVHDLVPLRFPEWTQGRTRRMHGAKYRNAARTCDVVFVNSEFTKGEVVELLDVAPEKVVVAYPGVGAAVSARGRRGRPRPAVRAHGRDARAAQEPRDAARRAGCREGHRARRRRRGGLGARSRGSTGPT